MWIHNECSFIAETQYETVNNSNCTWICPKCEFFNFSDSFFGEKVNLETENRFVSLTKEKKDRSSPCDTNKSSLICGLKFISMNINIDCRPNMTLLPPLGNFADIVCLKGQSFLHKIRDVCTL